jgi:nicotinamide-nucleotide amidase
MSELADLFGVNFADLEAVIAKLRASNATVATAESLTAGLVVAMLTEVPGASAVVRGGLIVYATELKSKLAGVNAKLLSEQGAVNAQVAAELAAGARGNCGASIGVGLTGVAGPDGQDGVAPGTVFIALDSAHASRVARFEFAGSRHAVRAGAVQKAIELLWQFT